MKKILLPIFTLVTCTFAANAQIELDSTFLPVKDKLYVTSFFDGNLTDLDPGTPGQNKTWDFANLTAEPINHTTEYFDPSEVPFISGNPFFASFKESNLASLNSDTNMTFYKVSDSGLSLLGILFNGDGGMLELHEPATNYKLPLTLGSANRSVGHSVRTFLSDFPFGTIDSIRQTSTMVIDYKVDASGKVTTPAGSFDAIRIAKKTILNLKDEVHVKDGMWVLSTEQPEPVIWSSFVWETKETGEPAIAFDYSDSTWTKLESVSWNVGSSEIVLNKPEIRAESALVLFPNPASDKFMLTGNSEVSSVAIYNTSGTEVMNVSGIGMSDAVSIADLEAGMYNVKISNSKGVNWKKLVVSK